MGKKSKRNKTNSGGPVRKGLAGTIYDTICRMTDEDDKQFDTIQFNEILKVESKYRHLDSFSDNPFKDAYVLNAFGSAIYFHSANDEACLNRTIDYFERAKVRMEDANTGDRREARKSLKLGIEMQLAGLYSQDRDMEKAISSHRWFLANGNRHQVKANYLINLSNNFNRFKKFEYAIEVLLGMDVIGTSEEKVEAETNLIFAYIECGEFLKAEAANKKRRRSTDKNDWVESRLQSGRIEKGLCKYKVAIPYLREVVAKLQKQENDDTRVKLESVVPWN